jgi:peptidoglycan hydrolase-like protein with peptidoglycan-binding domain
MKKKVTSAILVLAMVLTLLSTTVFAASNTMLRKGSRGDDVRTLQTLLNENGYSLAVDGIFGSRTDGAVRDYQARKGLVVDGIVGPKTWGALLSKDSGSRQASPPSGYPTLSYGSRGTSVSKLQNLLNNNGAKLAVDGQFGSLTQAAVKRFQSANGIKANGVVGSSTWKALQVENLISIAKSKVGSKYVLGGKGPTTFDCSGFVYWCLNRAGVSQAYMTSSVWQKCRTYPKVTSMSGLKRGDVISFEGHVGIYLGDGQMIDASSTKEKVRICSNIQGSSYWTSHFVRGYRIF